MNFFTHILLGFSAVELVYGEALDYLYPIIFFSTVLDLDHIPYILKTRGDILEKKFGSESRSRFHELYGVAVFSVLISGLAPFFEAELVGVVALCVMLHYAADFLVGKSRPFYPYSEKQVFLGICPDKYRVHFEVILSVVLGGIIWMSLVR